MTDDLGPTARALAHPKGSLTMTSPAPQELIDIVAREIASASYAELFHKPIPPEMLESEISAYSREATAAIIAVRAWDREQRDKLHERLAPKSACGQPRDTP